MGKERRRVTKEDVRNNAKAGSGGTNWMRLPEGVRQWEPEKAGSYTLNFLPYEVSTDRHPDKINKGLIWYKYPFQVHMHVGVADESLVCPGTIGLPCPMCQEKQRLAKDWDKNVEQIKLVNAKRYVAYVIEDPDDKDKVAVFSMSYGKFAKPLDKELQDGSDDILNFYDVTEDGRTLKVRFGEETYEGRKFIQANRFDFTPRGAMDEDEVLGKTVCLDDLWGNILPYEKFKAAYLQLDDDGKPQPGTSAAAPAGSKGAASEKASGKDKAAETPSGKFQVGDRVSLKDGKKVIVGKLIEIDDDDVTIETEDGKEHEGDIDDLSAAPAPSGKETKTAAAKQTEAPATPAATGKIEVGSVVKDEDGVVGKVLKIKGDDVTYADEKGTKYVEDIEDLVLVVSEPPAEAPVDKKAAKAAAKAEAEKAAAAKTKKVKEGDTVKFKDEDGDEQTGTVLSVNANDDVAIKVGKTTHVLDIDDVELAGGKTDKGAAKPLAVGDRVADDTIEGEIIKLKDDKAKVKDINTQELSWVPLAGLKRVLGIPF